VILLRRLQKLTGFLLNEDALDDVRSLKKRQAEFLEQPMYWREKDPYPSCTFTFRYSLSTSSLPPPRQSFM
jgi:hypothetical protein